MSEQVKSIEKTLDQTDKKPVVNDFQIIVATVNGTGSQTANTVLMRALFKMGIPVNGKNIFPSNIQGLPTWFTIRLSKDGYIARRETSEILVAMNQTTIAEDIKNSHREESASIRKSGTSIRSATTSPITLCRSRPSSAPLRRHLTYGITSLTWFM